MDLARDHWVDVLMLQKSIHELRETKRLHNQKVHAVHVHDKRSDRTTTFLNPTLYFDPLRSIGIKMYAVTEAQPQVS
jgi:hypothetical protein